MSGMFKRSLFDRLATKICPKPIDLDDFAQSLVCDLDDHFGSLEMSNWLRDVESWGVSNSGLFPHYKRHGEVWLKEVCVGASLYFMERRRVLGNAETRIDKAIIDCIPIALKKTESQYGFHSPMPMARAAYESCKACLDCLTNTSSVAMMIRFWFAEMAFNEDAPHYEMNILNDGIKYQNFNDSLMNFIFPSADEAVVKDLKYWHE